MKTKQLYQKYQIMPQLEIHMLRVAGVGKLIADNWISKCDSRHATVEDLFDELLVSDIE